jgi:hypothetical protein
MVIACDDIEPSKENLQPLAQGRRESSLATCAAAASAPHASRHPRALQFEQEIAAAADEPDPLEIWLRYIKWTEDEFASGGDRSHITVMFRLFFSRQSG